MFSGLCTYSIFSPLSSDFPLFDLIIYQSLLKIKAQ